MVKENIFQQKTLYFAPKLSKFYLALKGKKYYEIASQLFRSGTSIGANIAEAQGALTRKDFIHKMTISLKESYETQYWIEILEKGFDEDVSDLRVGCAEIIRILVSIVKSSKMKEQ